MKHLSGIKINEKRKMIFSKRVFTSTLSRTSKLLPHKTILCIVLNPFLCSVLMVIITMIIMTACVFKKKVELLKLWILKKQDSYYIHIHIIFFPSFIHLCKWSIIKRSSIFEMENSISWWINKIVFIPIFSSECINWENAVKRV